jgi:hypothetical protein
MDEEVLRCRSVCKMFRAAGLKLKGWKFSANPRDG